MRGRDADKRVSELFEITGLDPQLRHLYPHQLSGGMCKRALINAVPEFFQYKDLWEIGGEPPVSGKLKGCPFAPRCVQKDDLCEKEVPALCMKGIERKIACHKNGIEVLLKAGGLTKK